MHPLSSSDSLEMTKLGSAVIGSSLQKRRPSLITDLRVNSSLGHCWMARTIFPRPEPLALNYFINKTVIKTRS